MQKVCATALLLLVVCAAGSDVTVYDRRLMFTPSKNAASSTSVVHADIETTGGTVVAKGAASSKAFAASKDAFVKLFAVVISAVRNHPNSGVCNKAEALFIAEIKAAGLAVAKAAAASFSAIKVEGHGSGCVSSAGVAKAQASSLVKIIVDAVAIAANNVPGDNNWALAIVKGKATAIADRVASAFASAYTRACSGDNGAAAAVHASVAGAISKPITFVVVILIAKADCHGSSGGAVVVAGSDSDDKAGGVSGGASGSVGSGSAGNGGIGVGGVTSPCKAPYRACCYKTGSTCDVPCGGPSHCRLTRVTASPKAVWVDFKTKHSCHCD